MDQKVVAGIGNVYRAELLYRARLNPHTPGKQIPVPTLRKLWRDWRPCAGWGGRRGRWCPATTGAPRQERHYVYKRTGERPARGRGVVVVEDMGGRNLYWAPGWQTQPRPKPADA